MIKGSAQCWHERQLTAVIVRTESGTSVCATTSSCIIEGKPALDAYRSHAVTSGANDHMLLANHVISPDAGDGSNADRGRALQGMLRLALPARKSTAHDSHTHNVRYFGQIEF
jgi:hypothetical protein